MSGHKTGIRFLGLTVLLLAATGAVSQYGQFEGLTPQGALTSGITYQGLLKRSGSLVNGSCDLQFGLFDALTDGAQLGTVSAVAGVAVSNGLFSTVINSGGEFGVAAFNGQERYLAIAVQCPGDAGLTPLSPRQRVAPTAYALYATGAPWGGLTGVPAGLNAIGALSCANGQIPKWTGGAWSCGTDIDTDTNTTYTAYNGVHLTGTIFSSDTTYMQRRVSNSCPAGQSIRAVAADGTVTCEADDDTTYTANNGVQLTGTNFTADTAFVQRRVGGVCPAGSTMQSINVDGSVNCLGTASGAGFSLSTIDSTGDVGRFTSITIGADGLGLISYFDNTNQNLKVAHCNNTACSAATSATLDSTGSVGWYTSITIGADGLGLISYYDDTNGDLKVAHCNDTACSVATPATLDSTGTVGLHTSITIGADGLGLISYFDDTNDDLKVAHCNDTACSAATPATLDSTGFVGNYTSITIGADGLGLISYFDVTNTNLKVAHCNNTACSAATPATLDSSNNVGSYTSITIGADGLGLISYRDETNDDLKVAHCNNTACSAATSATLDSTGSVGEYTSITIGADGLGLISYLDFTNFNLKVAHCNNTACSAATPATLDSTGTVGYYNSITIGADSLGLISYYDGSNANLKVAHLSNPFGVPYFRRR